MTTQSRKQTWIPRRYLVNRHPYKAREPFYELSKDSWKRGHFTRGATGTAYKRSLNKITSATKRPGGFQKHNPTQSCFQNNGWVFSCLPFRWLFPFSLFTYECIHVCIQALSFSLFPCAVSHISALYSRGHFLPPRYSLSIIWFFPLPIGDPLSRDVDLCKSEHPAMTAVWIRPSPRIIPGHCLNVAQDLFFTAFWTFCLIKPAPAENITFSSLPL